VLVPLGTGTYLSVRVPNGLLCRAFLSPFLPVTSFSPSPFLPFLGAPSLAVPVSCFLLRVCFSRTCFFLDQSQSFVLTPLLFQLPPLLSRFGPPLTGIFAMFFQQPSGSLVFCEELLSFFRVLPSQPLDPKIFLRQGPFFGPARMHRPSFCPVVSFPGFCGMIEPPHQGKPPGRTALFSVIPCFRLFFGP